jgi:hypothetical protein
MKKINWNKIAEVTAYLIVTAMIVAVLSLGFRILFEGFKALIKH